MDYSRQAACAVGAVAALWALSRRLAASGTAPIEDLRKAARQTWNEVSPDSLVAAGVCASIASASALAAREPQDRSRLSVPICLLAAAATLMPRGAPAAADPNTAAAGEDTANVTTDTAAPTPETAVGQPAVAEQPAAASAASAAAPAAKPTPQAAAAAAEPTAAAEAAGAAGAAAAVVEAVPAEAPEGASAPPADDEDEFVHIPGHVRGRLHACVPCVCALRVRPARACMWVRASGGFCARTHACVGGDGAGALIRRVCTLSSCHN